MDAGIARRRPVQIVESGPAAGVLAAARLAREVGLAQVLAFDMGGTTAKASLIENGVPVERPGGEVGGGANLAARFFGGSGHAIRVPAFDIAEVGAGGGSIAWIDAGGALRVGPEGAGAQPGPVCYRRGGERPTVTDANVVLGYVNPGAIAGDTVEIDRTAAADAIETTLARPLGLSLMDAAYGIFQIANATTMRALRSVSIERGVDPRKVSLLGFGGAGPVHAAELAGGLGIDEVYIPPFPGIFSAIGLILADYRYDVVRSLVAPLDRVDVDRLHADLAELRDQVHAIMRAQGIADDQVRLAPTVDLQYRGQDIPLTLPLGEPAGDVRAALRDAFATAHRGAYGYVRSEPVEIVALRIRGTAPGATARITELARAAAGKRERRPGSSSRQAWFGRARGLVETPVIDRGALKVTPRKGPVIIEEWDTSIVVPPDWMVAGDLWGNVVMRRNEGRAS